MTRLRVLIVEDEPILLKHLVEIFEAEDYSVCTCESMRELNTIVNSPQVNFDIIILDRLLHGIDSAGFLNHIKAKHPTTPLLILSAVNTISEKANLLDNGADDYLSKPFGSEELIARVRALLRRRQNKVEFGNLILQFDERSIQVGDREVPLTNKEFALLKTLLVKPGKVFSKSYLYETVWGISLDVDSNVVESTMNKLRRRFKEVNASPQIKNSRSIGYWIEE